MTDIREFLDKYVNEDLERILVSNARRGSSVSKLQVRPVPVKGEVRYQVTRIQGTKAIHENYEKEELISYLTEQMKENFRQLQLEGRYVQGRVLVSKKGKADIKARETKARVREDFTPMLSHNRKKKYLLQEGIPVPWLVDLGVMTPEGKVRNSRYDKFKQLNRYLEFIQDILPKLPKDREIRIIDFECGKSYLTFAMYYYLKELNHYDIQVTGLDLKADVIEKCQSLADKYGYDRLDFQQGDIASYEGADQVDMVVTLHACDTATDFALAKAVKWGARVILSVPCCQHELNRQVQNQDLAPVLEYGILKERFAALLTDGLRAQMLKSAGYDTQILEFISMEHTPKNLLIRAVKNENKKDDPGQRQEWENCIKAFHVEPTLKKLMFDGGSPDSEGTAAFDKEYREDSK
ncbi:MAG TPA: SAM-dependent methyltransferase [Candidatus Blautia stercorigallinarum]|uniref:SAM-dependent methyltransferase n=1 Tax=Candidatus Blautia stercorigallinarum TaxID=2838501 RepID=A0A9D1PCU7_9FIRM|nr:SAM-dependent methyltransferase [Candidatus Blautia stercorigallinarum]